MKTSAIDEPSGPPITIGSRAPLAPSEGEKAGGRGQASQSLVTVATRLSLLFTLSVLTLSFASCSSTRSARKPKPIPVIFDADIGDDIDDTWALGFLLRSPELDLKLVVGDNGKSEYRAKILAKFLEVAGRTDVPVGVGLELEPKKGLRQGEWIEGYDLAKYPGKVHRDGVQAIIDTIMNSREPVTVIAVGPVQNLAAALKREPRIAQRAKFVGMHGSVRVGYNNAPQIAPEYNVKIDPKTCQQVFLAPWEMTITPLDTCDKIALAETRYQRILESKDPIASAIIENYRVWAAARGQGSSDIFPVRSTVLFDTVAVYLAFSQDWCGMEQLGIRVTDDGLTIEDPSAKKMNVAMTWKNLPALEDLLVERLTQGR